MTPNLQIVVGNQPSCGINCSRYKEEKAIIYKKRLKTKYSLTMPKNISKFTIQEKFFATTTKNKITSCANYDELRHLKY